MKMPDLDRNLISSCLLVGVAGVLTGIIILTDRKDITSAAVVLSALILFLTGVFLFTFTKKESLDGRISALLPVQNTITICQIATEIGIAGTAWFLPGQTTGLSSVRQFIPVSSYSGVNLDGKNIFVSGTDTAGMLIEPAGAVLFEELKTRNNLTIPDAEEAILECIHEVGEDILEVADRVDVTRNGDSIVITFINYQLMDGCRRITQESPACCVMNPCPVSSLCGMILAEGIGKPVSIDRCYPDIRAGTVTLLFTVPVERDNHPQ